ncbi:hypothetical protein MMC18_003214 [Xylographa bjoerkii]|nr:hypothetical protein [Xylographa bjoerkii]
MHEMCSAILKFDLELAPSSSRLSRYGKLTTLRADSETQWEDLHETSCRFLHGIKNCESGGALLPISSSAPKPSGHLNENLIGTYARLLLNIEDKNNLENVGIGIAVDPFFSSRIVELNIVSDNEEDESRTADKYTWRGQDMPYKRDFAMGGGILETGADLDGIAEHVASLNFEAMLPELFKAVIGSPGFTRIRRNRTDSQSSLTHHTDRKVLATQTEESQEENKQGASEGDGNQDPNASEVQQCQTSTHTLGTSKANLITTLFSRDYVSLAAVIIS